MVEIKILAALMTGLAAAACASAVSEPSPAIAAIDQRFADTASTGDSYRYCMQLGLEQAGLARPDSNDGAAPLSLRAN